MNEKGQFLIELNNSDIEELSLELRTPMRIYMFNDTKYFIEFPEESIDAINYFSEVKQKFCFLIWTVLTSIIKFSGLRPGWMMLWQTIHFERCRANKIY